MSRNQLDESTKLFRRGLAKAPEDARLLGGLAMVLTRRGELDEAITTCGKAVVLAPESADLQTICGAALFEKGDVEQAVRYYREALRLVPNHPEARRRLDQALEKLDRDAKTSAPAEPSGDP
ncbi:MAG: tetratricopeptide repeat protein [Planctomycetes bacterium]|nr:tetratricopeptide repeat protein [Planctomycetota bacterium]